MRAFVTVAVIVAIAAGAYLVAPLLFDREVDEPRPTPDAFTRTEPVRPQAEDPSSAAVMADAAAQPDRHMDEPMPPMDEIADLEIGQRTGVFEAADSAHAGSGQALLYFTDEDALLRLQEFRVTNGPDLVVLLARHPRPRSRADLEQGMLELGRLKGNVGNQNYTFERPGDLDEYRSAVIYCKRFHTVFATAEVR